MEMRRLSETQHIGEYEDKFSMKIVSALKKMQIQEYKFSKNVFTISLCENICNILLEGISENH